MTKPRGRHIAKGPIRVEDMDALLRFLPIFESPGFVFGERYPPRWLGPKRWRLGFAGLTKLSRQFYKAIYKHHWAIGFDWGAWGDEARSYMEDPDKLRTADIETIRKLLTAHVRADRFIEGHFFRVLESGHIIAILRRLKQIREGMGEREGEGEGE